MLCLNIAYCRLALRIADVMIPAVGGKSEASVLKYAVIREM